MCKPSQSASAAPGVDAEVSDSTLTMGQAVAVKLRDLIAQQALQPGERVVERDLAARLAVSRTPMREALRILAAEGLVEIHANRGAIVADPSAEEIHDLLAVLGVLEGLAGEQAAERATDPDIAEVRALHFEMLAAFERKDRLAYYKCNQAIHLAIVAASKNSALIETHARTNARLYRVRFVSNDRDEPWSVAIQGHKDILEAFAARDGERLSGNLRGHQRTAWSNVRGQLAAPTPKA
jgi:DNA-binding GntR family transcriptional regulator